MLYWATAVCIAHFAAPILTSAIGATSASGLSAQAASTLQLILKSIIINGINALSSDQKNILESILKGAGFSTISCGLGSIVGGIVNPNISEMHRAINITMTTGFESALRTTIERGKISENVLSNIGTGLLLNKLSLGQSHSLCFMDELNFTFYRSFIEGAINSTIANKHFGSSVGASFITGSIHSFG